MRLFTKTTYTCMYMTLYIHVCIWLFIFMYVYDPLYSCMYMTLYITTTAITVWIQNVSIYYQFSFVINLMIVTQIDLWLCILLNDRRLLLASFARTAAECPAVYFVGVMDQVRLWSYVRSPSIVYSQGIYICIYICLYIFIYIYI